MGPELIDEPDRRTAESAGSDVSGAYQDDLGITDIQLSVWAAIEVSGDRKPYLIAGDCTLAGELLKERFAQSLQSVVDATPALRSAIVADGAELVRRTVASVVVELMEFDLSRSHSPEADLIATVADLRRAKADEEPPIPFCFALAMLPLDVYKWVYIFDHSLVDGRSTSVVAKRVMEHYYRDASEPDETSRWEAIDARALEPDRAAVAPDVQDRLAAASYDASFVMTGPQEPVRRWRSSLNSVEHTRLVTALRKHGIAWPTWCYAAGGLLLAEITGRAEIAVGVSHHGRLHSRVWERVDNLSWIMPLAMDLPGTMPVLEVCRAIKNEVRIRTRMGPRPAGDMLRSIGRRDSRGFAVEVNFLKQERYRFGPASQLDNRPLCTGPVAGLRATVHEGPKTASVLFESAVTSHHSVEITEIGRRFMCLLAAPADDHWASRSVADMRLNRGHRDVVGGSCDD